LTSIFDYRRCSDIANFGADYLIIRGSNGPGPMEENVER